MIGYGKYFDDNDKCMNFAVCNKKLLKPYNTILDKISNLLEKGFDSELAYDNQYIRTKKRLYKDKLTNNFPG